MPRVKHVVISCILLALTLHTVQASFLIDSLEKKETDNYILCSTQSNTLELTNTTDYLIITTEKCMNQLTPFIQFETTKGFHPQIVSISDIELVYEGYDLPAKIRMFLREIYEASNAGLQYVLFVGNITDIPMRLISQDKGYGQLFTDFYYTELSSSDERSWDSDGDFLYGEREDTMDLTPEITLGRIPFSKPSIVSRILNNTIAFHCNNDSSYKQHMLLMGAFFWNDTDNAILMEEIQRNPLISEWTATTFYEQNIEYYSAFPCDYPLSKEQVYHEWSQHPSAYVNWAGHGTPLSVHLLGDNNAPFLSTQDVPQIQDIAPCVIFANACNNANPLYQNIVFSFLEHFAIGCIGPSTTSQAVAQWTDENDGSSQSFNYFFSGFFLSGDYTLGQAHQQALYEMNQRGLWYDTAYETFTWGTVYGVPDISVHAIGFFPKLGIDEITDGKGLSVHLGNRGEAPARNISWEIKISGGNFMKKTYWSGSIPVINSSESIELHIPIFGWGCGFFRPQPLISFSAQQIGIDGVHASVKANIIGSYVKII